MSTTQAVSADSEGDSHGSRFEVNIEGTVHAWPVSTITVDQLRELGRLPEDQPVIEVDIDTNEERTLSEHEVVKLKPGQGFGRKVQFKRG